MEPIWLSSLLTSRGKCKRGAQLWVFGDILVPSPASVSRSESVWIGAVLSVALPGRRHVFQNSRAKKKKKKKV